MADRADDGTAIPVWDLPVRIFHWLLVLCVAASLVTGEFGEHLGLNAINWHQASGLAILTLLLFRVLWGFAGGTHARFTSFVRGPRAVFTYVRTALSGGMTSYAGHNPAGGWSVLAMLASLALQAATGLFLSDEDLGFEAPLAKHVSNHTADLLKAVHEANSVVLIALIAAHLAAIAYHGLVLRDNLVKPMLTGTKTLPAGAQPARGGRLLAAAPLLALAAAAVWLLVSRA